MPLYKAVAVAVVRVYIDAIDLKPQFGRRGLYKSSHSAVAQRHTLFASSNRAVVGKVSARDTDAQFATCLVSIVRCSSFRGGLLGHRKSG
jgi:hypothetical protein